MYACLDLGSNSFHLLIARSSTDGSGGIKIVERFSEKVQLGEGVSSSGRISPAAFARGIACLHRFREVVDRYPIQAYWALGTNALRVAENAQEFVSSARATGFQIAVISGEQEARLVYAGVVSALPAEEEARFVVDIGGGSTELVRGKGDIPQLVHSLPLGCVSWRDDWFSRVPSDSGQLSLHLAEAVKAAESVFASVAESVKINSEKVYASSGTAKMLAAVCREAGLTDGQIEREALMALKEPIVESVLRGELPPGVSELRRELILPGWAILIALMQTFEIRTIYYSTAALREGMLAHMMGDPISGHFPPVTLV